MATYLEIQNAIQQRIGKVVQSCWIAHVKELNGLPLRRSARGDGVRAKPCPEKYRTIIEAEMRRLGIL